MMRKWAFCVDHRRWSKRCTPLGVPTFKTRQVYNLFQEPVEQPPLGFSIAEEKFLSFRVTVGNK